MKRIAYREMASLLMSRANCLTDPTKSDWAEKHTQTLLTLVDNVMPSGSGFDRGTSLDMERSTSERLVFTVAFHHMDEHGFYDGWTDHTVTVTSSLLSGIAIRVSGRNRNGIKDYIYETFEHALQESIVWHVGSSSYVLERMADLMARPEVQS
jgi:hypothetical protein